MEAIIVSINGEKVTPYKSGVADSLAKEVRDMSKVSQMKKGCDCVEVWTRDKGVVERMSRVQLTAVEKAAKK